MLALGTIKRHSGGRDVNGANDDWAILQEIEKLAAQIDWKQVPKTLQPPQSWFDDDDDPVEPEEEAES